MNKFAETIAFKKSNGSLGVASGATATIYNAGTSVLATLYQDDEVTTKSNPLISDADGLVQCKLADGTYDVVYSNGSASQTIAGLTFGGGGGSYDPTNVAITGGTINGVTIGNTSPPNGTLNNLTVQGNFKN